MRKQASIRITCKRYMPHNHQYTDKLFAGITSDALSIWCDYCHKAHDVTIEQCLDVFNNDKLMVQAVTCSIVSGGNRRGVERDIAFLYFWGARVWCMHCKQLHTISKDRCLRAWEQLRVEKESTTKRRTSLDD
jgi:hypothetical protein